MIITEKIRNLINTEEITTGTLIWAKHTSWDDGRTGIIKDVNEKAIIVLFLPPLQNVQNYFVIKAAELEAGEWEVRYSTDGLVSVISFGGDDGISGE